MSVEPQVLLDGMSFLECPRWHDDRLFVSDYYTNAVYSVAMDGSVRRVAQIDARPAGLDWLPDGSLLIVSQQDRKIMRLSDGGLTPHSDPSALMAGNANDLLVLGDGTAYVGNFGFDVNDLNAFAPAPLICVRPDGTAVVASPPLAFANTAVLTSTGTLVVAETMANRLTEFDIAPDGMLVNGRPWAVFGPAVDSTDVLEIIAGAVVGADGICIDADDCIWIADAYHNRVIRAARGGAILEEIALGDVNAYAVALGGPDARTLFMCTAPSPFEHERATTRDAQVRTLQVDIPAPVAAI